ncbi:hypothetical protein [Streptomyces gibsoniae]|uniref:Uncharacterized protein n=1 Tax=Streptomyces gibsoniae TaxID=3075529 RepID=A0ABU2U6F7_9ACTN|nr:hypothetical protein [Streptomyces sp. DSM 41699]MDT0468815.1 hypothetical protein [Streptomyces sp. DSM 41699]
MTPCVEYDRANLEEFQIRRRARLEETEPTPEELEDVKRRIRMTGRQMQQAANAMKAAGWTPARPSATEYIARHKVRLQAERRAV